MIWIILFAVVCLGLFIWFICAFCASMDHVIASVAHLDMWHKPLNQLTLGDVLVFILIVLTIIVLIRWLFCDDCSDGNEK